MPRSRAIRLLGCAGGALVAAGGGGAGCPPAAAESSYPVHVAHTVRAGGLARPRRRRLLLAHGSQALLRFRVPANGDRVGRAVLGLYVRRRGARALMVYRGERGGRSRWSRAGGPLARVRLPARGWVSVDVTGAAATGTELPLVLAPVGRGHVELAAGSAKRAPRLRVTFASAPVPSRSAPAPAPSALPGAPAPPEDPTGAARGMLMSALQDVVGADARRYGATDDQGNRLDCLKVLQIGPASYLGVYHAWEAGSLVLKLATSTDLVQWHHSADLDTHASQGTLAALPNGEFLVVYEKDSPNGNNLRFRRYHRLADLMEGRFRQDFSAPRTLSPLAEGTPNVWRVSGQPGSGRWAIEVGFHYLRPGVGDRQATGTLEDFRDWRASPRPAPEQDLLAAGNTGNIGDRDGLSLDGYPFELYEVQRTPGDWASWRTYLYDPTAGRSSRLDLHTDGGSSSFGNATASVVTTPDGQPALVVTQFVFYEGAAPGESGELIYVRKLGAVTASAAPGMRR